MQAMYTMQTKYYHNLIIFNTCPRLMHDGGYLEDMFYEGFIHNLSSKKGNSNYMKQNEWKKLNSPR